MDRPRKHHFVPQFYLKGFTVTGDEDGKLYVLDQSKIRQWESSPANAAHERDMYEMAPDGKTDPAGFEKMFAVVESKLQPALQEAIISRCMPEGDNLNLLFNFVMMMLIRVPAVRDQMEAMNDTVHKKLIRTWLATPEGWEWIKQLMPANEQLNETTMKQFVESDDYTVTQGQNWYLQMMAEASRVVLPAVSARKWAMWVAANDASDFICSDYPASVHWRRNVNRPAIPALAMRDTILSCPLNRRVAIVGTFERPIKSGTVSDRIVAGMNSMTAKYANQIYSSAPDFVCLLPNGIGYVKDVLELLRAESNV